MIMKNQINGPQRIITFKTTAVTSISISMLWFVLLALTFILYDETSEAAYISSPSSKQQKLQHERGLEAKKGIDLALEQNDPFGNKLPSPGSGSEILPEPGFDVGAQVGHQYDPSYDPDDHFKHYPDYRIHDNHLLPVIGHGDDDKNEERAGHHGGYIHRTTAKPTHKPKKTTTTTVQPPNRLKDNEVTTTTIATTTRPDWDYICYVLCGVNQGGLACKCDVLPIG